MLEELGVEYQTKSINIGKDEQFSDEFLAISPNNKIPVIIDHDSNSEEPVKLFESGAILIYLAEKFNRFLPPLEPDRSTTLQWLMFQMGGPVLFLVKFIISFVQLQNQSLTLSIDLVKKLLDYTVCLIVD
jgi:glutathione S-transferase